MNYIRCEPRLRGLRSVPPQHSVSLTQLSSALTTLSMLLTQQNSVLWLHRVMLTQPNRSNSCWNKNYEMLTWHFEKRGRSAQPKLQLRSRPVESCKLNCMMPVRVWMPKESVSKMWQD